MLRQERREELFRYIWGIIKNRHGHLYRINGVEDHLHILTSRKRHIYGVSPTVRLADFVKEIKTGSAHWIKEKGVFRRFSHWQEGYGAFTCSQRKIAGLIEYIKGQGAASPKNEVRRGIPQVAPGGWGGIRRTVHAVTVRPLQGRDHV